MKYVQVVGSSGSGKSTLARRIAKKYNLEYIEIDSLYWKEDWGEPTKDEFKMDVITALDGAKDGWVIDGTYSGKLGDIITSRVDTIIGLRISSWITVPRVAWRGFNQIRKKELLWGRCRETPKGLLQLLWWIVTTQPRRIRQFKDMEKMTNRHFETYLFRSNRAANKWLDSQ